MKVSSEYIQAFTGQLDKLDENTAKAIRLEIEKRGLDQRIKDGDADAYTELLRIMRVYVGASSQIASSLAAQYYDGIRVAAGVDGDFDAAQYKTVDVDELQGAVFASAKSYAGGKSSAPLYSLIGDVNSRFTQYAANESVRLNAMKDPAKPRFAIVPNPMACEFCRMRAGVGYQYPRKASVHSHNNCKCTAAPVFGNSTIQGYDPKKYEDDYLAAKRKYKDGDISDELKQRIEDAKKKHQQDYRDGKTNKRWDESNAVLMVQREMESG